MLTAFLPIDRSRALRRLVHGAAPCCLALYWLLFWQVVCSPDRFPATSGGYLLLRETFHVLLFLQLLCLAGSSLFLGQDLKAVYQTNRVPVLELILDAWPVVLAAVFLLSGRL
ncbi:hypothetical protein [Evtepia sp.]|uniref:hypothetical protein n=1 Tax=Evtepia sp. TaxID=2773933 RepID=UPI003F18E420